MFHTSEGVLAHNDACDTSWLSQIAWDEVGARAPTDGMVRVKLAGVDLDLEVWPVHEDVFIACLRERVGSLQEPERLIDVILRTSVVAIVFLDVTGQIVFANELAERILGLVRSDQLAQTYKEPTWHSADLEGRAQPALPFQDIARTLEPLHATITQLVWPDGERRVLEVNGAPVLEEDGSLSLILFAIHDISQSTEDASRLRRSGEHLRNVLQRVTPGVLLQGPRGEILTSNDAAYDLLGLTEEQLLGISSFDPSWNVIREDGSIFPAHTHPVPQAIQTAQPVRNVVMGVFRPRNQDRVWLLVNAEPMLDAQGRVLDVVCSFTDITQLKQTERELKRSENRLKLATEAARIGTWVYEVETSEFISSDSTHRLYGFQPGSSQDLLPRVESLMRPSEWARVRASFESALLEHARVDIEFEHQHTDGSSRHQRIVAQGQFDSDGEIRRITGIAMDTTETRLLEEQLLHAQKMESVGQLAGGVAHDFNNLLTAILSYLDLIEWSLEDEDTLDMIASARQAAENGATLTQQLLTFARKSLVSTHVFDLREMLESIQNLVARLLHENITLTSSLCEEPCWIDANPGQMEQVVLNLISNARDAMPAPGRLDVRLERRSLSAHNARAYSLEPGSYVCLTVQDTGLGMSPEVQRHIFEPFYTTKVRGKGTGLGLSTCYGIVSRADGILHVTSTPGEGSTFTIFLPEREAAAEPSAPSLEEVSESARGEEIILLVEDNHLVRASTTRALRDLGYHVHEASDGLEALDVLSTLSYQVDCVVTDVMMPRMGGAQLAREIESRADHLPILFASGYPAHELEEQGFQHSDVRFLQKPFDPLQLARSIRGALDS